MRPCVRALRSRALRVCALLLGLTVVSLTISDLFSPHLVPHWPRAARASFPPLRFAAPPALEVMLESWASESSVDAPLDSLLEEQLLSVLSTENKHKKSYKVLLPRQRTEVRNTAAVTQQRGSPDLRAPGCLGGQYSESLPSVSVILCFQDEPLSNLLRTLHSVLDTSPAQHLREILLLTDNSRDEKLSSALSHSVSHLRGVRLIHTQERLGPGRRRSLGASRATGDVLVMMGPRCECHVGWMEPLLERLVQNSSRVVSPVLDVVDSQTQKYNASPWPLRGVWDWNLDIHWDHPPFEMGQENEDKDILPFKSPALGGEVLAVDRLFFLRLGAYDPGIRTWGVQQVELSLRVWLCGGSMEVVPCSRVALVGGAGPTNNPPDPEQLRRDRVRVAEAWLGAFKNHFYRRDTLAHFIRQAGAPNLTERVELQEALRCRDLGWFLSSVAPELYVPQDRSELSGELYNVGRGSCVDYPRGEASEQSRPVVLVPCSGTGAQHCELNSVGELRLGPGADLCVGAIKDQVLLSACSIGRSPPSPQRWSYRTVSGQLVHGASGLCLQAQGSAGAPGGEGAPAGVEAVVLRPCSLVPPQQWSFEELLDLPRS